MRSFLNSGKRMAIAIDSLTRSICFHFFFNEFNLAAWILTDLTPRVDFFFLFTAGDSGYFSSSFIWLTHIQRRQFRFPFSFFRPCALFQGFKQQLLISSLPLRLPRVDKLWIFSPPSVLFFCFLLTFHHQFMYSDSCRCNHRSIEILIFFARLALTRTHTTGPADGGCTSVSLSSLRKITTSYCDPPPSVARIAHPLTHSMVDGWFTPIWAHQIAYNKQTNDRKWNE